LVLVYYAKLLYNAHPKAFTSYPSTSHEKAPTTSNNNNTNNNNNNNNNKPTNQPTTNNQQQAAKKHYAEGGCRNALPMLCG